VTPRSFRARRTRCTALRVYPSRDPRNDLMTRLKRIARAVRLLVRDGGLPRWLRGLAAIGLAPIPGPFDEVVLLVVAAILWLGYRERLRAAWRDAAY
jgi:hypothetical protein